MKLPMKAWLVSHKLAEGGKEIYNVMFARDEQHAIDVLKDYNEEKKFFDVKVQRLVIAEPCVDVCEGEDSNKDARHDEVNSPNHYCKGGIECIDVIKAATEGLVGMEAVCTANIIKYIFRWKDKNGTVDVKKCEWYIKRLIQELESNNEAI